MLCIAREALILKKLTFRVPRTYTERRWNVTIINMVSPERYLDKILQNIMRVQIKHIGWKLGAASKKKGPCN